MLLRLETEIRSYLPTSKWNDAQLLLSYVEEEEQNVLLPILGYELFEHLNERYDKLVAEYEGITADIFPVDKVDDEVRLLRICQKVCLYMVLANNSGLLSVSFNPGGGMNQVSSEYYDTADKDAVNRFERDAWKKAHRNIDALLTLLERDARSENPMFKKLWQNSRYFYLQSNLLLTTASQMQDYLDIKGSRERYIELVPDMKYCQSVYLTPQVGEKLMDAFIRSATDDSVIPIIKDDTLSEGALLAKNGEIRGHWIEALDRLRSALANYTEHRNVKMRRADSLSEGDMQIARAVQFISEHQDSFMPYVETSPLYQPPRPEPIEKQRCDRKPKYDPNDPDNRVTVLASLNRY